MRPQLTYILLLFFSFVAQGQQMPTLSPNKHLTQFALSNWTSAEGLHSNTLIDVCQTSDGYIWVSGYGGLSRFDGISFSVFGKQNHPQAFYTNTTTTLYEDASGTLWVGTEGSGLLSYKNGVFKGYGQQDGFVKRIEALFEDKSGTIWLGTRGAGTWVFDRKKITPFEEIPLLSGKIKWVSAWVHVVKLAQISPN